MNILFLCTANIQRSKTAELLFRQIYPEHRVKSAGLSRKYCERNGSTLCTAEHLDWAHLIFVMERKHIDRINEHVGSRYDDKLINLNIDDVYQFNDAALIRILKGNELISQSLRDSCAR
ncbi:TPA: protein tyrosine phosphatase [Vibrio parahaemolyticus]|nr:protein tyrosine phosphatase [Vibrio parahaemolyticus]HBC3445571.1 protein tyrosine phosphatase [Vibrio parahaemolyticus]HBC3845389.1 protein tyrosine phosphatase [Vibrio parahaemolyticus]HBH7861968.1 protein tyrosine phosphatase [Vibrio parahaemolyticus]HBH7871177.1 protein tyrosine phosphatase [Vibrio parahaemolyticus]